MALGPSNLTLFTGKGGVGKSLCAASYASALKGRFPSTPVYFTRLKDTSLGHASLGSLSQDAVTEWLRASRPEVERLLLSLEKCAEEYIARKLRSQLLAKGVVHTPFFASLVNMIPGFQYVIYLGKLLQLISDSDLKANVVLDAPSTGHALVLLQATLQFQEIFKKGLLYEDTKKMMDLLKRPGVLSIVCLSYPRPMDYREALEFRESVSKDFPNRCTIIPNACLLQNEGLAREASLIDEKTYLGKRIQEEKKAFQGQELSQAIPYYFGESAKDILVQQESFWQNQI